MTVPVARQCDIMRRCSWAVAVERSNFQVRRIRDGRRLVDVVQVTHEALFVEQVHRAFQKHRPGHAVASLLEGLFERRHQLTHRLARPHPLHVGLEQRQLINILERATAFENRRRSPSQQNHRRLRQLGVLDRRNRVGDPGPGGHRRHPDTTGQARRRIGRERRRHLVANVDHPDTALFGAHQDRRDMPAAEGEEKLHALLDEDVRHQIATGHGIARAFLDVVG